MRKIKLIVFIVLMCLCCDSAYAFSDVCEDDWFFSTVTDMTNQHCINGYPDGSFRPSAEITGGEFVSIIGRIKGLTPSVPQCGHWASDMAVSVMNKAWYDYDELPPTGDKYDEKICRQLAVKIIMNAFVPQAVGDYNTASAKIKDFAELDGRYYDKVFAAYACGIAKGDENGFFHPDEGLTRAEACALISRAMVKSDSAAPPQTTIPAPPADDPQKGGVSENGQLCVIGTQLCNSRSEPVILNGFSSHGLQWFPSFADYTSVKSARDLGANVFRFAMYTDEGGYISNHSVKDTLIHGIDCTIALDMYAIIDWHILSDGNPMTHKDEAVVFFREMAERYGSSPSVLYEICNEPNGNVSWSNDILPYAKEIIEAIREIDPDGIILVGSPTWSQDLHLAAAEPLDYDNIMYTCHFYAGTHTDWLRDRIKSVMNMGLPVFISEWGTSAADGSGGVFTNEAEKWVNFMNENNISRVNWSWCDKDETSAAVKHGADISDGIDYTELSDSGKFTVDMF